MRRVPAFLMLLVGACSSPDRPVAQRVMATPVVTPSPTPAPTPSPEVRAPATRRPVAAARPRSSKPRPASPAGDASAFRGLGGWIDVFDYDDDPQSVVPAVRDMAARGVRTLYLESARFNSPNGMLYPRAAGAALDEAHERGMRVVAWYPPDLTDVDRDLARTLDAYRFTSPGGGRFDAIAPDIERTDVKDPADRNARLVDYSRRLREAVGAYPLAAIVIAPTSLEANPARWPDFPWQATAPFYDVYMPMNYWTARSADAGTASERTSSNVVDCRRLTGRPVHVIGGTADRADEAQVSAYVEAAIAGGSIGGGLYDYATTRPEVWDELARLNGA